MEQQEVENIYSYHVKRTEEKLNSLGNNSQAINTFITNTYAELSQKHPSFLWFSLGTLVSGSVGHNLQVASQAVIHSGSQAEAANVVLSKFSEGNQAIFKNIVPVFLTYESVGIEGIENIRNSVNKTPFQNNWVIEAIEADSILQSRLVSISNSLGLSVNDPKVIEALLHDQNNMKLAHTTAMGIAMQEQIEIQDIYGDDLVDVMLNPALGWVGHQAKLDEIEILGGSYCFFDYIDNPADLDQRLNFAEVLLRATEEGIINGEFSTYQSDVLAMAACTLWMGNPFTSSNTIDGINGAYWGEKADEFDLSLKNSIIAFINDEPITELNMDIASILSDDNNMLNIPSSVFTDEYEITKINVDPLALFLETHPHYEVIAQNAAELFNDPNYNHSTISTGTALWNHDISYLGGNGAFLAMHNNGEYHYHQPYGEVRGITFPFLYDTTTGMPLTQPLVDGYGHFDHISTVEAIYTDPEAFNTPSHIHWYNPYWYEAVQQAHEEAVGHYLQTTFLNNFTNSIMGYSGSSMAFEMDMSDILHSNSSTLDFSNLDGDTANGQDIAYTSVISSIELESGVVLVNDQGNFVCVNCNDAAAIHLENAANQLVHHFEFT